MKRTPICFLALASLSIAQELPITRLASITYQVGDLDKARQFYTGIMGLEEPFKVPGGASFKLNDDQYLEFIEGPAPGEGFRLVRLSMLTPDIDRLRSMLLEREVAAGEIETGSGGNRRCTVKDPVGNQIDFVQYTPASNQWKSRGKALGANRATDHLLHAGIASDGEGLQLPFYAGKLGFREQLRGGPDKEIRWIIMGMPSAPDYVELMIHAAQPAPGRQHICFEVPDIQRTYKQLVSRGLPDRFKPFPAQNNRWIMNLRDPYGIRVEIWGRM